MWRDEAYLLDILIAARKIVSFTSGVSREQFQQDELLQNAVMRPLTIIGETARSLSPQIKSLHPEIPWEDMIGLRNRLVHEYFRIDMGKVWDTVEKDIPVLIRQIEPLVPPDKSPS